MINFFSFNNVADIACESSIGFSYIYDYTNDNINNLKYTIMKVFINKRVEGWSGGLAIVAANNAEEAHRTYCFSDPTTDYFDKDGNYCDAKRCSYF